VRYKTIEAGRSHRQQSFLSHPWTACTIAPPIVRLVMNGQPVRAHRARVRVRRSGSGSSVRHTRCVRGRALEGADSVLFCFCSLFSHPAFVVFLSPSAPSVCPCHAKAIFPLADSESPASVAGVGATGAEGEDAREVMTVHIEHPQPRVWSTVTHATFPACFRDAARTLVLAHARLAAEAAAPCCGSGGGGGGAARGLTLGHLPTCLRDVIIGMAAPQLPLYLPVRMPRPQTPDGGGT
jgi:hypothetical protein